jgi:hypothetical protein
MIYIFILVLGYMYYIAEELKHIEKGCSGVRRHKRRGLRRLM